MWILCGEWLRRSLCRSSQTEARGIGGSRGKGTVLRGIDAMRRTWRSFTRRASTWTSCAPAGRLSAAEKGGCEERAVKAQAGHSDVKQKSGDQKKVERRA